MRFTRSLAVILCIATLAGTARAELFEVRLSARSYSLSGVDRINMHVFTQRQIIGIAAQSQMPALSARVLTLVYDTANDALEVVRKADGTIISTYMQFGPGQTIQNAALTRKYRQALITLPSQTSPSGSADGPLQLSYDSLKNVTDLDWEADFQYSLPSDANNSTRVVHGRFTVGPKLRVPMP